MKYLRDKHGMIWGIVTLVGVGLIAHGTLWSCGLGSFMVGLSYGAVWSRALRGKVNED